MSSCILFCKLIRLPAVFYARIKQLTCIKQKEFREESSKAVRAEDPLEAFVYKKKKSQVLDMHHIAQEHTHFLFTLCTQI